MLGTTKISRNNEFQRSKFLQIEKSYFLHRRTPLYCLLLYRLINWQRIAIFCTGKTTRCWVIVYSSQIRLALAMWDSTRNQTKNIVATHRFTSVVGILALNL